MLKLTSLKWNIRTFLDLVIIICFLLFCARKIFYLKKQQIPMKLVDFHELAFSRKGKKKRFSWKFIKQFSTQEMQSRKIVPLSPVWIPQELLICSFDCGQKTDPSLNSLLQYCIKGSSSFSLLFGLLYSMMNPLVCHISGTDVSSGQTWKSLFGIQTQNRCLLQEHSQTGFCAGLLPQLCGSFPSFWGCIPLPKEHPWSSDCPCTCTVSSTNNFDICINPFPAAGIENMIAEWSARAQGTPLHPEIINKPWSYCGAETQVLKPWCNYSLLMRKIVCINVTFQNCKPWAINKSFLFMISSYIWYWPCWWCAGYVWVT